MSRVYSIDYLRGLMAIAVLFYHYLSWTIGTPEPTSVIGRLGIYAVSTFYIVSGMSLYLAYSDAEWNLRKLFVFVSKRYLRLAPAFWLGCSLMLLLPYLTGKTLNISLTTLISNITLTFGFTDPRNYFVVGGWSIGNEMVFYAFFPLIMWFAKPWRGWAIAAAVAISLCYYFYYAFFVLAAEESMVGAWSHYIQPENQAFLFFIGIGIAWASRKYNLTTFKYLNETLVASLIIFAIYPSSGNAITIVTNHERIIYTALCVAICFSVFNTEFKLNHATSKILTFTGDISYSLYILHGAFAMYTLQVLAPALSVITPHAKLALLLTSATPLLLLTTYVFYNKVEKPIMRIGKRMEQPH